MENIARINDIETSCKITGKIFVLAEQLAKYLESSLTATDMEDYDRENITAALSIAKAISQQTGQIEEKISDIIENA
jgi:hypothetical protein